jgi:precorrin-6B methylase 2
MKVTKPEIIGILFAKLKPEKHEIFADIGCGSGSVSEFFAPFVRKVYAVDVDENMVDEAEKRLDRFKNAEVLNIDGLDFLEKYDYDILFFGGTKNIREMLKIASEKAKKIAVNAARIEVAVDVIDIMKKTGIFSEALILTVSKSYELAGKTAFKSLNPVFMVVGQHPD